MFEDFSISVGKLGSFLVLFYLFCHIRQHTENVRGCLQVGIGIFRNAQVAEVMPIFQPLTSVHIPSERTLCRLLTSHQLLTEFHIFTTVFLVDIVQALFKGHAFFWQEVAVHVHGMVVVDRKLEHAVIVHVEGVPDDHRQILSLL